MHMELRQRRGSVTRTPRISWAEDAFSPPPSRVRLHKKARAISRSPSPRSPSPRSPSPRVRVLRGRTVRPSPRAVEKIDAQVSVRRRSRRSSATPASTRSSFVPPSLSCPPHIGQSNCAEMDPEEDLATVRNRPEAGQEPIPRRRPRGSGERAAELKSIRKAMPKPPRLGMLPDTVPSQSNTTSMGRSFGKGFASWRAWAWVLALLVIVLCTVLK